MNAFAASYYEDNVGLIKFYRNNKFGLPKRIMDLKNLRTLKIIAENLVNEDMD